ncbi:tyrosine/serine/threonine protein phosphatase [Entomophthora muscae]|uniref:Tyrosine/serine/threonine protein phosphatase n=1 Tax=Entomophthora muscae TaxID=34485 RepID=A0ACC2TP47_9FUNG|nr:tyrosine/serine/threonine protein phosphatase [Entomophthora muscae]
MLVLNKVSLPISLQLSGLPPKQKKRNFKNLALCGPSSENALPYALPSAAPQWLKPQQKTYSNGPKEILENLYLGDEMNASDPDVLKKYNIGFILNVAKEVDNSLVDFACSSHWQTVSDEKVCLQLKKHTFSTSSEESHSVYSKKLFWDHNQDNIQEFFAASFNFINLARSLGVGVLIHCQCGVSRSASLMIGYVMQANNLSFESAYQHVKSKSSVVSPNLSLIAQLLEFENGRSSLNIIS